VLLPDVISMQSLSGQIFIAVGFKIMILTQKRDGKMQFHLKIKKNL